MRRSFRGIALSAFVLCSFCALAQSPPLTLAEAQRRAVERSRELAAVDLAAGASRAMAVAAGELPDPVLKLQLQNVPIEGQDRFSLGSDSMTMRSIGIMQEWTRPEKRSLKRERFEQEAERIEADKIVSIAAIQRRTAFAWLDVYYAQAVSDAIVEQSSAANAEVMAAQGAYRGGRGSQADVLAAMSAAGVIDDRASEAARKLANARLLLARWVGPIADAPLGTRPDISATHLHEHTLEHQVSQHPDLEVLRRQEQVARTEAKLAMANKKSDVSFEVMYGNRASQFGDMATIGISVPLQIFQKDRQDREVAAKLAAADQVRAEREEMERSHLAEIRAMVAEWRNGLERMARYERELLPLARERTRATLTAYEAGKSGANDLLMARRNEVEVRLQALQLEMETARLWAQLEYLAPDASVLPASLLDLAAGSKEKP